MRFEQRTPQLRLKLEGWRSLGEDRAKVRKLSSVGAEVLDAETLARVVHYDVSADGRGRAVAVERRDQEQAMYSTALKVCFGYPHHVFRSARYLVVSVEADERHRTGAGWRLVPPSPAASIQPPPSTTSPR